MKQIRENDLEWRQFCRLGEMMGDGLHYESDGKWIAKEYNKLAKLLIPELSKNHKELRKAKTDAINEQMGKLLQGKKCNCGGEIKQGRSGSKIAYCEKWLVSFFFEETDTINDHFCFTF